MLSSIVPAVTLVIAITPVGSTNSDLSEFPVHFKNEWDCQYHAVPIQEEIQDRLIRDGIEADVDYICIPKNNN